MHEDKEPRVEMGHPNSDSPRFTVALAVAALSDDYARAVWERSEYQVMWTTNEGHELVWVERDSNLPLLSWDVASALQTLEVVLDLDYDADYNVAFPYAPDITKNDLVAFALGMRSCLRSVTGQPVP